MATDQEIRDAGFKFIPQQQYLQNPFNLPVAPEAPVVNQGIVNTNAFNDSDGFSVYNADPNTISNMNPNRYALQDARYDNELSYVGSPVTGYTTDTAAMKHMGMYPEYYGLDKPPPSKISQLISKGIGFIPGIGTLSKIGNFAAGLLPENRRAIMENQLGTQGVMVNDIGQIVVGPGGSYNTPEGIMAGYNVAKMTDETFTDRIDTIENTLKDKYNMTDEEIEDVKAGIYKGDVSTDLFEKIRNIEIARKNFADSSNLTDQIVDIKTDTKNKKRGGDDGGGGGIDISGAGTIRSSDNNFQGDSGPTTQQESDYGYGSDAGFFARGGRVNFKNGGLASLL